MSSTPSTNVITFTDNSQTIVSMTFVSNSIQDGSSNYYTPPTIQKSGNVFTITFMSDRHGSSDVATSFNSACGGAAYECAADHGGGTPNSLNFYFALTVNVSTPSGNGLTTLYVGQGNHGTTNNWWLGGSCINSSAPSFAVPLDNGVETLTMPLSGSTSAYTFSAGTITNAYPIRNIFVLMLENHSFDNMLAMSGIPGITAATTVNSNAYQGSTYYVSNAAPTSMPVDPGHEFTDVVEQLAGAGATYPPGGPYPTINNSGYVANYAYNVTLSGVSSNPPLGDIMACFNTPQQLPVMYQLASTFTLCDHWFSSMPGPTWPNRFFVHGASSNGLDHSPSKSDMFDWFLTGFKFPHGSIFDALRNSNISYRLYNDRDNQFSDDPSSATGGGWIPQVASIEDISISSVQSLDNFATDLQNNYTAQYTFIEPNYGDIASGTYSGGSSQHPMDDVYGGENLIKYVYESIRNSPLWNQSLLIITYDEHGGFYDSVIPGAVTPPNDGSSSALNENDFAFNVYGTRVPAIVVSPWVAAAVSKTTYDHGSALATIEALLGVNALTDRDAQANSLVPLLLKAARTDCPTTLNAPAQPSPGTVERDAMRRSALWHKEDIPDKSLLQAALAVAFKAEFEASDRSAATKARLREQFMSIRTRGDAAEYFARARSMVAASSPASS